MIRRLVEEYFLYSILFSFYVTIFTILANGYFSKLTKLKIRKNFLLFLIENRSR